MAEVAVSGSFDDFRSSHVRLLHEASRLGALRVCLWNDEVVAALTGKPPTFPLAERLYVLEAVRYVSRVTVVSELASPDRLPEDVRADTWAVPAAEQNTAKRAYCREHRLSLCALGAEDLSGFPYEPVAASGATRPTVVVTGCFDWFHSGHVRFFEECAEHGDLHVVVGNDANVRLLKGRGHPMFPEAERRYVVGAVRFVTQALISTGSGWLDAEPEIDRIGADIYAVNEDGDKPEKREFCASRGIRYLVLERTPKAGLPRRQSTDLRGF